MAVQTKITALSLDLALPARSVPTGWPVEGPRVAALSPGSPLRPMVLPPLSMDLGLLLIAIGVVNLWQARL